MQYAIGYSRLSDEGTIETQHKQIADYCNRYKLTLLQIFADDGVSGGTFNRPGWKALEKYLQQHQSQINFIIIRDTDRMARTDFIESMWKRTQLQTKYGVKILTLDDTPDTNINDVETRLVQTLRSYVAQKEREKTRDRILYKQLDMKRMGYYPHKAPTGYLNQRDEQNRGVLVIDPERAPLIAEAYRMFMQGVHQYEIRRWLNGQGVPVQGNSAMNRLLSNPVYAGLIEVPAMGGKDGFIEKGRHPAIISQQLFEAVQVKLNRKTPVRHGNEEVYLRGVLHTEQGHKFTAGKSKGRSKLYWYYVDHKSKQSYPADKLHTQFEELLKACSFTADEVTWLKNRTLELVGERMHNGEERKAEIKAQLQAVEKQIKTIQTKYLTTDTIDEPTYKGIITGYFEKRIKLNDELAGFEINHNQIGEAIDLVFGKLINLHDVFLQLPLFSKHKLVNNLFGGFLYYSRNSYRTAFLSPILQHKALILKEKGLLVIEQPVIKMGVTPVCAPQGSIVEPLQELALIFAA